MSAFHTFRSSIADQAYAVEVVFDPAWERNQHVSTIDVPLGVPQRGWVVAGGLATADGRPFPYLSKEEGARPRLQLLTPWERLLELDWPAISFADPSSASEGIWRVRIQPGETRVPFSVAFSTFASAGLFSGAPPPAPPPPAAGPPGGVPPFRCRACKVTAKGLAVAIVAAVAVQTAPAALVAAVSSFLGGVGTLAAAAFINSVVGDTADVVAEKLCVWIGLC